jgi:ubiquinone/menaquinone biosynthesis C-methylase UbiE
MTESVSFDRVADRYDATRGYPAEVAAHIAAELMRLGPIPAGASLLEIGIGTGRIALPLLTNGVNMTGVDISPLMTDQLRTKYEAMQAAEPGRAWGTLTVQIADMTALPFTDGSFDAAVGVHVLHLVPEWKRALDETLRVIRPGGALLMGQDTHPDASTGARVQDEWHDIVEDLGYTPKAVGAANFREIVNELRRRGLTVTEEVLATWESEQRPDDAVRYIAERTWSRTWAVPDDIFAESVKRLQTWADAHFAGRMTTPAPVRHAFKVARAAVK